MCVFIFVFDTGFNNMEGDTGVDSHVNEIDDNHDKLEGKKEEKVKEIIKEKEVIKYLNVTMGIFSETKFNPDDLKEFNEFKAFQKTKNLFRSYENMSKNIVST